MSRAPSLILAALLITLASPTGATPATTTTSGLYGTVAKGPIRPLCQTGQPCTAPAQVTLLFTHPNTARTPATFSTRSTTTGNYRVSLTPGHYTVTTKERIGITRNIRPNQVHVRAGHWDNINLLIDTGIR
jgi:hypothetical protein